MTGVYDPGLVVLSLAVAIMTAYVALALVDRVVEDSGRWHSWLWLISGAVVMGTGIWSMHFIGMLAFSLPVSLGYDLALTLLSLLIAVLASGLALFMIRAASPGAVLLSTGALLFGAGVSAMHYTGMAALRMSPPITYDPLLFVASILIAVAASFAALWMGLILRRHDQAFEVLARLGSATVMGIAIAGMHYTGMAAAEFVPGSVCLSAGAGYGVDSDSMAVKIAIAMFIVLAITVALSTADARRAARVERFAARLLSANERLQLAALHDALTGLPNRVLLSDRLTQAQHQADRSGKGFTVMFIDLDHFKAVNDGYGHRAGDDLLRSVAQAVGGCLRSEDTLSRTGGDEFVAVLNGTGSRSGAEAVARKMLDALVTPQVFGRYSVNLSCSIGIALYPGDGADIQALLARADTAMYAVKGAGRNGYRFAGDIPAGT